MSPLTWKIIRRKSQSTKSLLKKMSAHVAISTPEGVVRAARKYSHESSAYELPLRLMLSLILNELRVRAVCQFNDGARVAVEFINP